MLGWNLGSLLYGDVSVMFFKVASGIEVVIQFSVHTLCKTVFLYFQLYPITVVRAVYKC